MPLTTNDPREGHSRARLGKVERALLTSHPKGSLRGEVRVRTHTAMTVTHTQYSQASSLVLVRPPFVSSLESNLH